MHLMIFELQLLEKNHSNKVSGIAYAQNYCTIDKPDFKGTFDTATSSVLLYDHH